MQRLMPVPDPYMYRAETPKRSYPIIRFLIRTFYALALAMLIGGAAIGAYLWWRAEALRDGIVPSGPLSDLLHRYGSSELLLVAAVLTGAGLVGFLVFGAIGQMLAMSRDRALNSALQVLLLEDILELNEEVAKTSRRGRVDLCEGCGRLGSLQEIDSGQWVCRECRHQLRHDQIPA